MDAQRHYWDTFGTLKANAEYITRYQGRIERLERHLNLVSAIVSSSAIAGWAIWRPLSFLWAVVIAASQVLTVIRPHLPYRARLSALTGLGPELEALALAAEADWYKISRGGVSEQEVFRLAMVLKRKALQATHKHFKGSALPEDAQLRAVALRERTAYMLSLEENGDGQASSDPA